MFLLCLKKLCVAPVCNRDGEREKRNMSERGEGG